jgi:hypothetical protein
MKSRLLQGVNFVFHLRFCFTLCRQFHASSVFFLVANFHNLARGEKNGPCPSYKGIFLKKIGLSHHIVRKKYLRLPYLEGSFK